MSYVYRKIVKCGSCHEELSVPVLASCTVSWDPNNGYKAKGINYYKYCYELCPNCGYVNSDITAEPDDATLATQRTEIYINAKFLFDSVTSANLFRIALIKAAHGDLSSAADYFHASSYSAEEYDDLGKEMARTMAIKCMSIIQNDSLKL